MVLRGQWMQWKGVNTIDASKDTSKTRTSITRTRQQQRMMSIPRRIGLTTISPAKSLSMYIGFRYAQLTAYSRHRRPNTQWQGLQHMRGVTPLGPGHRRAPLKRCKITMFWDAPWHTQPEATELLQSHVDAKESTLLWLINQWTS